MASSSPTLTLRVLAVRPPGEKGDHHILVPVRSIAYFFMGTLAMQDELRAPWGTTGPLRAGRVHARSRDAVHETAFRSISEIHKRLSAGAFVRIHQSVVVGVDHMTAIDVVARNRRYVGVRPATGAPIEWLPVSRRSLALVRTTLGLPRRRGRGGNGGI